MNSAHKFKLRQTKGFTLIEVVLVLAIGGLIFLLAFLAFNQVATNRRDSQRRNDASRILAEIQNFYTNTGKYPDNSGAIAVDANLCTAHASPLVFRSFVAVYMCTDGRFDSPKGVTYGSADVATVPVPLDTIKFYNNRSCGDDTTVKQGVLRVEIGLEKGVVCKDNT